MKRSIYITLAIIGFTFAAAETSLACSCIAPTGKLKTQVSNAYKDSDAIFSGKVISMEKTSDGNYWLVKLAVNYTWKGTGMSEITIKTALDSAMCGYRFENGKEYLVYAHGTAADLYVGNCSRTGSVSENGDVKYLANLKRKHAAKK
ncbi:MAG: hypothetical protein IPG67_16010 [Acidobacteria bacterium]|nr:hypothetical protein [Acidobacteriota bacterium]